VKALICGTGIAGLTLAWHLERSGWEVELVERAPGFRDGGYMIDFYGAGYDVATRMGLDSRLLEVRYLVSEISYVDRDGRQTSNLTLPAGFHQIVSLLRGDLARTSHDQVHAPVHYHTSVERIEQSGSGVSVGLTDGTDRQVDLLVGADGAHSQVRQLAFGPEQQFLRYLGHHVAAYIFTDQAINHTVGMRYQMLTVPGLMAGAYALRDGRSSERASQRLTADSTRSTTTSRSTPLTADTQGRERSWHGRELSI
jgi:2-polyprenyl-6-methoxyphenol hydroxylase-like FAD-dependent oxidoreductase